jgi:hypothetical protein
MDHILMENRNSLAMNTRLIQVSGITETDGHLGWMKTTAWLRKARHQGKLGVTAQ